MFRLIEMEQWERREHFKYYMDTLPCGYSLTAKLDVTGLLARLREQGVRFYPAMLYLIASTVNGTREFCMGVDGEGRPGFWDEMHLVHTVFHEDDKTFSDIWTNYHEDFSVFRESLERDIREYGDKKGAKVKPGQPPNFFCVSCTPWLHYEGYSAYCAGGRPALFPVITFGKYEEENGRLRLPLTVTISHAAADGYHTSMFFQDLQERIDRAF